MRALKIIIALISIPIAYIVFENALAVFIPAGWAAAVSIVAALTLGIIIGARSKKP